MLRIFTTTAAAALMLGLPASAASPRIDLGDQIVIGFDGTSLLKGGTAEEFERRGRKRKGRSKPRVPGGSGCDDPGDILEHPECAG